MDIIMPANQVPPDLLEYFEPVIGGGMSDSWVLGPEPLRDEHYAAFPTEIPKRAILAGTSEAGACPECGAPWKRVTKKTRTFESGSGRAGHLPIGKNGSGLQGGGETVDIRRGPVVHTSTTGWQPTCSHGAFDEAPEYVHEPVPCTVLDICSGSGTTVKVAKELGRHAIGVDLKAEYHDMAIKRLQQDVLPLEVS